MLVLPDQFPFSLRTTAREWLERNPFEPIGPRCVCGEPRHDGVYCVACRARVERVIASVDDLIQRATIRCSECGDVALTSPCASCEGWGVDPWI